MLIAFPQQQWLSERASILCCTYLACLAFVVCCVGSGLCDLLMARSEEYYRMCVCA
jgi:hypothetical protein